jgi:hypothetical protein
MLLILTDSDSDGEDPSNQQILWGPEDEVYHDDAPAYTMPGPAHWQVNCFIDSNMPLYKYWGPLRAFGPPYDLQWFALMDFRKALPSFQLI